MNYEEQCLHMMRHLGAHYTPENFAQFLYALSMSIARTVALVDDHAHMHEVIDRLSQAIHAEGCREHVSIHGDDKTEEREPIDAETFLREVFKPESFNG